MRISEDRTNVLGEGMELGILVSTQSIRRQNLQFERFYPSTPLHLSSVWQLQLHNYHPHVFLMHLPDRSIRKCMHDHSLWPLARLSMLDICLPKFGYVHRTKSRDARVVFERQVPESFMRKTDSNFGEPSV